MRRFRSAMASVDTTVPLCFRLLHPFRPAHFSVEGTKSCPRDSDAPSWTLLQLAESGMLPPLSPWPACMPCGSNCAYASHIPGIEPLFAASPTFHPQDQLRHGHCVSSTPLHLMVRLHHYQHRSCATIDQDRSALSKKILARVLCSPPPPTPPN